MNDALAILARAESDLYAERGVAALRALDELGDPSALPDRARARAALVRSRAQQMPSPADTPAAVDRLLLDVGRALAQVTEGPARALLERERAYLLSQKRCPALALAAADAAVEAWPGNTAGPDARASVHLQFDRRNEALAALEGALSLEDPWRARLGLARVCYVTGDFARLERELDAVETTVATRLPVLRWRSVVAQVRGDWAAHLALVDEILALTEGGYRHRSDQLHKASSLFKLGRRDEARELYSAVWKADGEDSPGRFARAVRDTLERNDAGGEHVALPAFPTVSQKRNYCGPASLELVLRYLGVDADQDTIAAQVKLPHGSPMVRLTRYLEGRGLATRRFESTPERLKACLRRGLPVILQEEYSTTTHVAVLSGIDERVGLLTVQDPMTHVPSERLVGTQTMLGSLFRNGALVAFRPDDADTVAALDEAGVVDAEHIRLLDSCDEGVEGAEGEEGAPARLERDEVLRRCREALRLCDDYLLARLRLCEELLQAAQRHASPGNVNRFLSELRVLRVRYGAEERPHQVHARYLYWQDRLEEALIEYEDALRLDPGDSNNAQAIAECHQTLGRRDEATKAFWDALAIDPEHVRATENFAAHALDGGDLELAGHLSACALDMAPDNAFNHITASRLADERGQYAQAVAHARKAAEVSPDWVRTTTHLAELLCRDGATREEGLGLYRPVVERHPKWFHPRQRAAYWTYASGAVDDAVALLAQGVEVAEDDPADLVRQAFAMLEEQGRSEDAVALGARLAEAQPTVGVREAYAGLLRDQDRYDEALAVARALHDERPDSAVCLATLGAALLDAGDDAGEEKLQKSLALAPTYQWARATLARWLLARRPERAAALLGTEVSEQDGELLALRAEAALVLGDRAGALRALEACFALGDAPSYGAHTTYVAAQLGERSPAELFELLSRADSGALPALRARLALALALRYGEEARALLPRIARTDWVALELLASACETDDSLRDELEARLTAAIDRDRARGREPSHYHVAMLAGSRAARGDRASLEALFRSAKRVSYVRDAVRSLDDVRHCRLIAEVREAAAAREASGRAAAEMRVGALFSRGEHAGARRECEAALERFPRSAALLEFLSAELLAANDPAAHDVVARLAATGHVWSYPEAFVCASRLLRGETAEAHAAFERAAGLAVGSGWPLSAHPFLAALGAALVGDAEGFWRAAKAPGSYHLPGAPLWDAIAARCGLR